MEYLLRNIGIEVIGILADSPYLTIYGKWQTLEVVIKCTHEKSIDTDEYDILKYIQENVLHPKWFPQPYFKKNIEPMPFYYSNDGVLVCRHVRSILVYEYIPGECVLNLKLTPEDKKKMKRDLTRQLIDLHNIELSYNDVVLKNIYKTPHGYRFIGFDRVQDRLGIFKDLRGLIPYSGRDPDLRRLSEI